MIDIDLESIDKKYTEVLDEVNDFRDNLKEKCQELLDLKTNIIRDIQGEMERVKTEWEQLNREKLEWQKEIEKIQQIQPIDDIVELNVGGKEDFCIRKSTLCQI